MQNWLLRWPNPLVVLLLTLTAIMLYCSAQFGINDYVAHPQHGKFDHFTAVSNFIQKSDNLPWYKAFFIVDFVWAITLLYLLRVLVSRMIDRLRNGGAIISNIWLLIFTISCVLAYALDVVEGIGYLGFKSKLAQIGDTYKMIFYPLVLLQFLFWVLRSYVLDNFRYVLRFVQTSVLSLTFIGLIYILLTAMPQGGTIIVDMFDNFWGIIVLFVLLTFLAIILSHFPIYNDIWLNDDNRDIQLIMSERAGTFLGMGLIYYSTQQRNINDDRPRFNDRVVSLLRRSLGILLYIAVFNIVLGVAERFYSLYFNSTQMTSFLLVLSFFIYAMEIRRYYGWKDVLYAHDQSPERTDEVVRAIIRYVRRFPIYLNICIGMAVITTVVAAFQGWSRVAVGLFLVTLGLSLFLYIYFKLCRTFFKYVYYSTRLDEFNPAMFNRRILAQFQDHPDREGLGGTWLQRQYGMFSDNVRYLAFMRFFGILSLLTLIAANFSFGLASWLNPLIVIMLYIIVIYSVIIIGFKHVLYYARNDQSNRRYRSIYRYGLPTLIFLLIGFTQYSKTKDNYLHMLRTDDRKETFVAAEDYFKQRTNGIDGKKNFFFVGSYGGGLKANLWNLLLFNELDKRTRNGFTENTLVMSGVSGGAVGIANYASILNENGGDRSKQDQAIFNIGKSNVLSNELVYLVGKDLIREYLPGNRGKDRSYMSMRDHAKHTGMGIDKYEAGVSFSDYWYDLYDKRNGKYPILVMNTTSTLGRQGVVTSVDFEEGTFPAADYLSDLGDPLGKKDLHYFDAVSTTNRFPLFSPSAEIEGKGTYVDGGYFENSGMLSSFEIYDTYADQRSESANKIQPVFVNIINSKDYYIAYKVLEEWGYKKVNQDKTSEIPAILSTVVSIDKLPRYVFDKIEKEGYMVKTIMMPHLLSYEDVKTVLRGDVDKPVELMKNIEAHNKQIRRVLAEYKPYKLRKWGVVEPPLARLLSIPAVRYQEAMVYGHPEIKEAIACLETIMNTSELVDSSYQCGD